MVEIHAEEKEENKRKKKHIAPCTVSTRLYDQVASWEIQLQEKLVR